MRFRSLGILVAVLLLAAATLPVSIALAEGSENVLYDESGDPFWFLPTVRVADDDPLWLVPVKVENPVTSIHIDFIAGVLGYAGDPYHYNSSMTIVVVDLSDFDATNPTFDWTDHVVYQSSQTIDWFDYNWTDYRSLDQVDSHLVLDVAPSLSPGYYGIGIYTTPAGAFPGEFAIVSAYGKPTVVWLFQHAGWRVNLRYYHPIGTISVVEGESGGQSPPEAGVKIISPKENDMVSGIVLVIAQAPSPPVLWVDSDPVGQMDPVLMPNFDFYYRYFLDTRAYEDGLHNLTVKCHEGQDSIAVTFDNIPDTGTIKVTIDAPMDGSVVPPVFKFIVTVSWENITTPGVTVYVNNDSVPGIGLPSPPPSWMPPQTAGMMVLRGVVDTASYNLTAGDEVEFRVVAQSGEVSAEAVAHYIVAGDHPIPEASVVRTIDGYKIITSPDVIAVIAHRGSKSVMAEQTGAGEFFVPTSALSPEVIAFDISADNTEFEAIAADGSSTIVTYSPFSIVGGTWWEDNRPGWWPSWLPWWVPVLLVVILFLLGGRKRRRRR